MFFTEPQGVGRCSSHCIHTGHFSSCLEVLRDHQWYFTVKEKRADEFLLYCREPQQVLSFWQMMLRSLSLWWLWLSLKRAVDVTLCSADAIKLLQHSLPRRDWALRKHNEFFCFYLDRLAGTPLPPPPPRFLASEHFPLPLPYTSKAVFILHTHNSSIDLNLYHKLDSSLCKKCTRAGLAGQ